MLRALNQEVDFDRTVNPQYDIAETTMGIV